METSLEKGYIDDAGCDIKISEKVIFKAHKTTIVNLGAICTPAPDCMGYLVARTSAAKMLIGSSACSNGTKLSQTGITSIRASKTICNWNNPP